MQGVLSVGDIAINTTSTNWTALYLYPPMNVAQLWMMDGHFIGMTSCAEDINMIRLAMTADVLRIIACPVRGYGISTAFL